MTSEQAQQQLQHWIVEKFQLQEEDVAFHQESNFFSIGCHYYFSEQDLDVDLKFDVLDSGAISFTCVFDSIAISLKNYALINAFNAKFGVFKVFLETNQSSPSHGFLCFNTVYPARDLEDLPAIANWAFNSFFTNLSEEQIRLLNLIHS